MNLFCVICVGFVLQIDAHYVNVPTDHIVNYLFTECKPQIKLNTVVLLAQLNNSPASVLYPHLIQSECRFLEISIDCDKCLVNLIAGEYKLNHKILIVDYVNFDLSKQSHLVDRMEYIYKLCAPKCNSIVLLSGPNFVPHKQQPVVAQTLLSTNYPLSDVVLGYYNDNDPSSDNHFMYIRPVVHGCVRYNGILIPNSKEDWKALTTKPSHCNLNGTTLNVVMNKVSFHCIQ